MLKNFPGTRLIREYKCVHVISLAGLACVLLWPMNIRAQQPVTIGPVTISSGQTMQITTYDEGDTVAIQATLNTSDSVDFTEGEPLILVTSTNEFSGTVSLGSGETSGLDHGVGHLRPLSLTRQRACWHIMTLQ